MTYSMRELRANGAVPDEVLRVRQWRRAHHLTQDECAALIGVRRQTLCAIECGGRPLGQHTARKLRAFWLLWGER